MRIGKVGMEKGEKKGKKEKKRERERRIRNDRSFSND